MAEYIDRDMLIVEGWHMERLIRSMDAGVATITIETKKPADFPAADVRPVVHGRWIDMDDHLLCSSCGAAYRGVDKNYCPNCGADMRTTINQ